MNLGVVNRPTATFFESGVERYAARLAPPSTVPLGGMLFASHSDRSRLFLRNFSVSWLLATLLITLCGVSVAQAAFSPAYRAYERGDYASAFQQFSQAARRGHAPSQISLGWMYAQGLGVSQDDQQALYWYRQAADQGHPDARAILSIRRLGGIPKEGQEVITAGISPRSDEPMASPFDSKFPQRADVNTRPLEELRNAAYWYRKHAELGSREAQVLLGVRYELGQGIPKDAFRATYWYHKAAEQGLALGQFNLGLKYAIGESVPLDSVRALYWYQRAAAQGHLESQYLVGVAYAQGNGVSPRPTQAVRWLRSPAERGYAPAQFYLGLMYAKGEGVARDWPQAYLWFSLAAAQGHDDARRHRDDVRSHIGPAEMAKIEQWARNKDSTRKLSPAVGFYPNAPVDVSPPRSLEDKESSAAQS